MKFRKYFVLPPGMIKKARDLTSLPTHVFSHTTSHFSKLKLDRITFDSIYRNALYFHIMICSKQHDGEVHACITKTPKYTFSIFVYAGIMP